MISCEPDHPRVSPSRHTCVNTYAARSHPRGLSSNCSLFKELDQLGPALDKLPSAMPNNATRPTIRRAIWQVRDCTVIEWVVNLPRDLIWSFSRLSFNLPQTSIRRYRQNCRMDRNRPQMPQKPPSEPHGSPCRQDIIHQQDRSPPQFRIRPITTPVPTPANPEFPPAGLFAIGPRTSRLRHPCCLFKRLHMTQAQ